MQRKIFIFEKIWIKINQCIDMRISLIQFIYVPNIIGVIRFGVNIIEVLIPEAFRAKINIDNFIIHVDSRPRTT